MTTATITPENNQSKRANIAVIRAIADRYVRSAQTGDSAILQGDFLPDVRVRGYIAGVLVDISGEQFLAFIDKKGPATGLKAEIEAIDVVGGAASLRIDCEDWHGVHYSDFLNLVKIDGVWKVAGKVFDAHEAR